MANKSNPEKKLPKKAVAVKASATKAPTVKHAARKRGIDPAATSAAIERTAAIVASAAESALAMESTTHFRAAAVGDASGPERSRVADAVEPRAPGSLASGIIEALIVARHGDPFAVLGPHRVEGATVVRALLPHALSVEVLDRASSGQTPRSLGTLVRIHDVGLFEGAVGAFGAVDGDAKLRIVARLL